MAEPWKTERYYVCSRWKVATPFPVEGMYAGSCAICTSNVVFHAQAFARVAKEFPAVKMICLDCADAIRGSAHEAHQ